MNENENDNLFVSISISMTPVDSCLTLTLVLINFRPSDWLIPTIKVRSLAESASNITSVSGRGIKAVFKGGIKTVRFSRQKFPAYSLSHLEMQLEVGQRLTDIAYSTHSIRRKFGAEKLLYFTSQASP